MREGIRQGAARGICRGRAHDVGILLAVSVGVLFILLRLLVVVFLLLALALDLPLAGRAPPGLVELALDAPLPGPARADYVPPLQRRPAAGAGATHGQDRVDLRGGGSGHGSEEAGGQTGKVGERAAGAEDGSSGGVAKRVGEVIVDVDGLLTLGTVGQGRAVGHERLELGEVRIRKVDCRDRQSCSLSRGGGAEPHSRPPGACPSSRQRRAPPEVEPRVSRLPLPDQPRPSHCP